MVRPGSRRIRWMEAITPCGRSASFETSRSVARSVKASTPLRRYTVRPLTSRLPRRSSMRPRVMSGRSESMAVSMLATRVMMSCRAAVLFCSTSSALSRWMVRMVDTPKPMIRTRTITSVILVVSRARGAGTLTPGSRDPPSRARAAGA